jgi:hypothetical protein
MQSNIDPDRINKIEAEIHTNRISAEDRLWGSPPQRAIHSQPLVFYSHSPSLAF